MRHSTLRLLSLVTTSFLLTSSLHLNLTNSATTSGVISLEAPANARSSGARGGGGSFRSRSSSPSRSRSSSPSRSYDGGGSYPSQPRPYYGGGGGTVIVPVPGGGPGVYGNPYNSPYRGAYPAPTGPSIFSWLIPLILLGVPLGGLILFLYWMKRGTRSGAGGSSGLFQGNELDNDIVTVSRLQVALLAQAREVQERLNRAVEGIDTNTPEGLQQLLQESVLALLRTPENWSHVRGSSQTVKSIEEAEALFNRFSIVERSKFSVETLTNVGGKVRRQDYSAGPDEGPAAYIVVTLLVGTADDKPLFDEIYNEPELREALEKLAAIPPDYLLTFELLWSPQEASDSLTYDELLTEYSDMVQI